MNQEPNEPQSGDQTAADLAGHWHKLCALLMLRSGQRHIAISSKDVEKLLAIEGGNFCIVVQEGRNGDGLLHLDIMGASEAAKLKAADVLKRTSRGQRP